VVNTPLRDAVRRGVTAIGQYDEFRFVPALIRLLAHCEPVSVARLAAAGGWSEPEVRAGLARQPSIEWDEQGRLAGFGLTLRPPPHRFDFDGRTVYAWCASDTLSFPLFLGTPAVITSTCPVTGQPIRVEVTPRAVAHVEPASAVFSAVRPATRVGDIRTDICALGHFFASREAAAGWACRLSRRAAPLGRRRLRDSPSGLHPAGSHRISARGPNSSRRLDDFVR
jgi:alkylmercury lyase